MLIDWQGQWWYHTEMSLRNKSFSKVHRCKTTAICNNVHITWDVPHSLHWRHNGRDSVSNHQSYDCLLKCLFRRRSKKISKRRVTGLCAGNSPESDEFTAQRSVMRKWSHLMMSLCLDKTIQFTKLYELKTVVSKFGPNIYHWILLKSYVDSAIIFTYLLNMNNWNFYAMIDHNFYPL